MFWFHYKYITSLEIFNNLQKVIDYWILEIATFLIWLIFIISFVFYIIPMIKIRLKQNTAEKEKRIKRKMLDKIVIQKNLEDIIKREIDEKNRV